MSNLRGVLVRLKTAKGKWSGTDDHIYVGIFGKGGGRELPLDVHDFDDFEEGSQVKYWIGDVWDGTALSGARNPYESQGPWWNNPKYDGINLEKVDYVYLRKQGDRSQSGDDLYQLDEVEITIYGSSPIKRTFARYIDIKFGNEYGNTVWIPED